MGMGHWAWGIGHWAERRINANSKLRTHAVCNFLSNLTPNPFPTREGEQESKPLSLWGRGMEVGF
ncbi:hypothetical protein [Nostoc sp.]|uniref:hypothetical protein n=1 Tax=Nostoc sp. TaxID=1180 RepID=UPI003593BF76